MICIITTEQLVAYLDGVAEEKVLKHVHRCAHCQRKAGELERAQQRFAAKLFGHTCPSAMELGEYHLGTLSAGEAQRIRTHLRQCSTCRQQLDELQHFVDDRALFRLSRPEAPPPPTILYPYLAAAMSGYSGNAAYRVRGSQDNQDFTYKIQESEINIEIQDSYTKLGHKTIWGLVVGLEADELLSAQLRHLDQSQASSPSEVEAGTFTIEDVLPGEYELLLSKADSAILLRDLNV
ncbi:MAG: anti-sigma factor family protein [Ardenticatenaceae bacterium]